MNAVVLDANIIVNYFNESVRNISHYLTNSAIDLVEQLGSRDTAYIDDENKIEHEYFEHIDREWGTVWLARMLQADAIRTIPLSRWQHIRGQLSTLGFPVNERDRWYIQVALTLANCDLDPCLISEDLHFFKPDEKNSASGTRRQEILLQRLGPIPSFLDGHSIDIHCVACHYSNCC